MELKRRKPKVNSKIKGLKFCGFCRIDDSSALNDIYTCSFDSPISLHCVKPFFLT